ncbi:MAG: pyruvate dehydrogenase complex dihydrolipoamide acetyltransferase [Alphaproteobacteria bacterium]|nr:pyruvate dehydrogenase complex dihydrolipoamide acetyltransferase [Alphaproteobacteria bacterium]
MPIQILMPALSPTMTEGNLVKWLKKPGDVIKAGQVLAEIETDKATMEVEAVDEGILGQIVVQEGAESVQVNALIGLILEEGEDASALESFTPVSKVSSTMPAVVEPTVASTPALVAPLSSASGRIIASPVAKRLAAASNIDLSNVSGTGPRGRIIKADVESVQTSPSSHTTTAPESLSGYVDIPLNMMRKVIAKRLVESKQTIPHFYLTISCEIDALLSARAQINETREKADKISVNDFVILAVAKALKAVPDANVSFHDNIIRKYHQTDISVAVAIDGGLVTPIIRNASAQSLGTISSTMKQLAEKARAGKLQPEEFQGGSFCISNLGMYGVDQFQAIINPPQACILAIGAGTQQAVVKNGNLTIATVMNATLSVDHRAVDGALGAQFLAAFKGFMEAPLTLFV